MWERGRNESATFIKNLIISLFLRAHNQGNEKSGGSKRDRRAFLCKGNFTLDRREMCTRGPGYERYDDERRRQEGPYRGCRSRRGPGSPAAPMLREALRPGVAAPATNPGPGVREDQPRTQLKGCSPGAEVKSGPPR